MNDFTAARRAMVDCQVRPSDVTHFGIIAAMLDVPRELFVPASMRSVAYSEAEIPLTAERALMPARTFAKMLEAVSIGADDLVLDLAPGTGYSSAVLSHLAAAVIAVEPDEGLAKLATGTIADLDLDNVVVSTGNASDGDAAHGPYDIIVINGSVEAVPEALTDQLKPGGRLVAVFHESGAGQCRVLVRGPVKISGRYAFDASAPPVPGFEKERTFAF